MIKALLLVAVLLSGPWVEEEIGATSKPPEAEQILRNPDFEQGYWGWGFRIDANLSHLYPRSGVNHWLLDGAGSLGIGDQSFRLSELCEPGPVWIRAPWMLFTPWPPGPVARDSSDGWIEDEQGQNVAWLWSRTEHDMPDDWIDTWYRVEGLHDVCRFCTLTFGAMNDDDPNTVTAWLHDDMEVWCVPKRYRVWVPGVRR